MPVIEQFRCADRRGRVDASRSCAEIETPGTGGAGTEIRRDSPPLLITGETGTGKSLIARHFHRLVAEPPPMCPSSK